MRRIHREINCIIWMLLLMVFINGDSGTLCESEQEKCSAELVCGERSTVLSMTVQGLPGQPGLSGMPGEQGPIGPQGLPGPSGHDGFTEQPIGFHAELKRLFIAKTHNRILRPWKLSDSFNLPNVSNYFSHETGIFTVPESGLYQFFLTIAVSHAQASVHIAKNGQPICTIRIESIATISNKTIAWGWSSNSIDCLVFCQMDDQISVMTAYHFNTQIYGYSYSTFSGYRLLKKK